jgi:hypothetical protein
MINDRHPAIGIFPHPAYAMAEVLGRFPGIMDKEQEYEELRWLDDNDRLFAARTSLELIHTLRETNIRQDPNFIMVEFMVGGVIDSLFRIPPNPLRDLKDAILPDRSYAPKSIRKLPNQERLAALETQRTTVLRPLYLTAPKSLYTTVRDDIAFEVIDEFERIGCSQHVPSQRLVASVDEVRTINDLAERLVTDGKLSEDEKRQLSSTTGAIRKKARFCDEKIKQAKRIGSGGDLSFEGSSVNEEVLRAYAQAQRAEQYGSIWRRESSS